MTEQNKQQRGTTAISVRLPDPVLEKLDKFAADMGSHRTDVVRRALATYFRLTKAILVPISEGSREKLEELAEEKNCNFERLAEELLESAIQEQIGTLTYTHVKIKTTQTIAFKVNTDTKAHGFTFSKSNVEGAKNAGKN